MIRPVLFLFIVFCLLIVPASPSVAQPADAPCGVITGFEFPVPGISTERTDFGIFRARYDGLHTGIDVAFEQLGSPVLAAADGLVTYSDPAGWDTEKGVVVIQHTLPDGSLVNTLYGHMEELNGYYFPLLNTCIEQGAVVGAVGFPSLGRPHLHYEVRTRYRYSGGPGYTDENPLTLGWYHPVDFTYLAQLLVQPGYRQHFTLTESALVPPLRLSDGNYVIAHSAHLEGLDATGEVLWRFDTLGSVTSLLELPDGRVVVVNSADQVLILDGGSFSALWPAPKKLISAPFWMDDRLLFMTEDFTLMALTLDGYTLWETASLGAHTVSWARSGDRFAVATENNALWVLDAGGSQYFHATYADPVVAVDGSDGDFYILTGGVVSRLDRAGTLTPVVDTGQSFTYDADLLAQGDRLYVYSGEGRSLYAYDSTGALLWIAFMPGSYRNPPLLGMGSGQLLYVLSTDGQLLVFDDDDGRLVAQRTLYTGGVDGSAAARWLLVEPDDTVHFSSGFLSVVTLDGLALQP